MLKTLKRIKIGFIPLSLYIILVLAYLAMTISNIVPENDMLVSLGIMTVFAYLLEEIGKTIPILKDLGGKVLVVTFLPAFLVYKHWLPQSTVTVVSDFMNNRFSLFS